MLKFSLVQNTKVLAGCGIVLQIGELLKEAGYKKAFLVFGLKVKAARIIDKIATSLSACDIEYIEFDKVLPDAPAEIVNEGSKLCNGEGCDCVIAVGGGSAIDMAKGITILRFNEGQILDYGKPGAEIKKSLDYSNTDEIEDAVVNEPFAGLCPVQVTKNAVSVMLREALDILC